MPCLSYAELRSWERDGEGGERGRSRERKRESARRGGGGLASAVATFCNDLRFLSGPCFGATALGCILISPCCSIPPHNTSRAECSLAQCSLLYADKAAAGSTAAPQEQGNNPATAGGVRCGAVGIAAGATASLVGCLVSHNSVGLSVSGSSAAAAKRRGGGKVTVHKCLFRHNRLGAVSYLAAAGASVAPSSVASSLPTSETDPAHHRQTQSARGKADTRVVFSKNTFFGTGAALARDERIAGIQVSVRDNVVVGAGGFRSQE